MELDGLFTLQNLKDMSRSELQRLMDYHEIRMVAPASANDWHELAVKLSLSLRSNANGVYWIDACRVAVPVSDALQMTQQGAIMAYLKIPKPQRKNVASFWLSEEKYIGAQRYFVLRIEAQP